MLEYRDRRLCLYDAQLEQLADTAGTPAFVLSERRILDNHAALVRGLAESGTEIRLRYCAKTNHESAVLRILVGAGCDFLVSHLAEAELVLGCGGDAGRAAYQRPVAIERELRAIAGLGITRVHLSRPADLEVIERVAADTGVRLSVSLRLRRTRSLSPSPLSFLGRRHGLDDADVPATAARINESAHLELDGLNYYGGTQLASPRGQVAFSRRALRLAADLQRSPGTLVTEINLGGGIPSPSLRRLRPSRLLSRLRDRAEPPGDNTALEAFARTLGRSFRAAAANLGTDPTPALTLEPGRSIVGDAGVLLTRVLAVDGRWIFVDASHNYLPESSLLFARPIVPVAQPASSSRRTQHVSGSALNSMDVLDLYRRLPDLRPGDLLAVCDAGAYSISRASRYADAAPAVYALRRDGSVELVRRREGVSDLTSAMLESEAIGV